MQEQVLAAARKIADANPPSAGRVVSLAELRRHPDVRGLVAVPERLADIMRSLAEAQQVRMVARHPEPRWYVSAP